MEINSPKTTLSRLLPIIAFAGVMALSLVLWHSLNLKELGEETGADEYVTKPFDMEELVVLVKEYLEK